MLHIKASGLGKKDDFKNIPNSGRKKSSGKKNIIIKSERVEKKRNDQNKGRGKKERSGGKERRAEMNEGGKGSYRQPEAEDTSDEDVVTAKADVKRRRSSRN